MQFFRFTASLVVIVAISLTSIAIQKRNLTLQRQISLQQYRSDQLLDRQAQLRLRMNELTSPMRHDTEVSQDSKPPSQLRHPALRPEHPQRSASLE